MKLVLKYFAVAAGAVFVCLGGGNAHNSAVKAQQVDTASKRCEIAGQARNDSNVRQIMKPLTDAERRVIVDKATEAPFSGKYVNFTDSGVYVCRQCGAPLYRSADKFDAGCGWPSFDDQIGAAVRRIPDPDGRRTEIVCAACGAHLGHVFTGEGFTPKNTRYCVNSVSLDFVPSRTDTTPTAPQCRPGLDTAQAISPSAFRQNEVEHKTEIAYFAGGCFWGVEYLMRRAPGVVFTEVGYTGGRTADPTYEQVCGHDTGHAETVKVVFDPAVTSYETLARLFFDIHDPTQVDRQGPDVGDQYRSEIFFTSPAQKATAEKLIAILRAKGYRVATKVEPAGTFYRAEEYHQDYYDRKGSRPYCHTFTERF